MARDPFDRFVAEAGREFGMDEAQATDLLEALEADGFDLSQDKLAGWYDEAVDVLDDVLGDDWDEPDESWEYDLDPRFLDDEWLDPDVEYEITADYKGDD